MVIWLTLLSAVEAVEVQVLVSAATPPAVLSMLNEASASIDRIASFPLEASFGEDSVVLDYLYDRGLSFALRSALGDRNRYCNMWEGSGSLSLGQLPHHSASEFSRFLAQINLTEVVLISDTQDFNLQATAYALENYASQYRQRVVISEAHEAFCQYFVARTIKPRGVQFIALFTNELITAHILSALRTYKMDRNGHAVVLSEEASYYRYVNSSSALQHSQVLVVAREAAESWPEVQRQQLASALRRAKDAQPSPTYHLYRVQNSRLQVVSSSEAACPGSVSLQQVVSQLTTLPKIPIDVSANYQFVEPSGLVLPSSVVIMRGVQVAVEEINASQSLIPDYFVRDNSVRFTGVNFEFNFTRRRVIEGRDAVGLMHFPPPMSHSVQGVLEVFESLNIAVPVSGVCIGSSLSSKERYPLFVRPLPKNVYILTIMCRAIISFGWKRLAVLYQEDGGDCEEAYAIFKGLAAEYRIDITNSESRRGLPRCFDAIAPKAVNDSLAEILHSDARVVLMISLTPYVELQRMYDAGFREDHAILMLAGLTENFYSERQYYRQRVVSKGAFMFFLNQFVGGEGEKVKEKLIRYDNSSYFSTTCLYYDSAMLYFHATDFLLEHGKDFEDPHLIVDTMRKTRFQGCSGIVQIDPDSNDRASGEIAISNFHYDARTDTYEIKVVGVYNPYISEPMRIHWDAIQWPNGESSFSDSKPKYRDCDYLARDISNSSFGETTGIATCFGLTFLVCVVGLYTWKATARVRITMITQKFYPTQQDDFSLAATLLDFFTLASVGPSTAQVRASLHGAFTLLFEELLDSESEVYWRRFYCVLSIAVWWVAFRLLKRCKKPLFLDPLVALNDFFTPVVTRVCFVLFAVPLLQVFVCSKGRSEQLGGSILDTDCHTTCWSKNHAPFAIASGVIFIVFSVETMSYKLNSATECSNSNVRTNPLTAAIKHPLCLVAAASFATFRTHSSDLHAYIHLSSVSVYFATTLVFTETNYARLNLWSTAAHFAVVLTSLAAFMSRQVAPHAASAVAYALFGAYGSLLAGVCIVQWKVPKYESKLVRRRRLDIRHLLEFGFTAGRRAQAALVKHFTEKTLYSDCKQQFELEI